MKSKSGIYKITCLVNGKIYIGSTFNLSSRRAVHFSALKNKKHVNRHLQNAYNKYGGENFTFEYLEHVSKLRGESKGQFGSRLTEVIEQYYLDTLLFASENDNRFYELGYNLRRKAHSNAGIKCKESVKKTLSVFWTGKKKGPRTEEHTRNLSLALVGKRKGNRSQAAKDHLSRIRKGEGNPMFGKPSRRRPVHQLDLTTKEIVLSHESIFHAVKHLNAKGHTSIVNCLSNRSKSAYGFKWAYV